MNDGRTKKTEFNIKTTKTRMRIMLVRARIYEIITVKLITHRTSEVFLECLFQPIRNQRELQSAENTTFNL